MDVYDYLNMKSSGHLIAALGLHGFNFSAVKGVKGQVLDFVVLLQEKQHQHQQRHLVHVVVCHHTRTHMLSSKSLIVTFLKKKWFARWLRTIGLELSKAYALDSN